MVDKDTRVYRLAVGAMFKNEAHVMKEWIEHYLYHGVEHFYMIDDGSTDASIDLLQPYIERGLITLWQPKWAYYLGRQRDLYNHFILPRHCEAQWLLMVDLDEFMWSPRSVDLREVLDLLPDMAQIQVKNTVYGSNGLEENPLSIVAGYTRRSAMQPTPTPGIIKYFINSNFRFTSLNVHHATFEQLEYEKTHFIMLDSTYFILNHYQSQSLRFWCDVKCTRGDSDHYRVRTLEDFKEGDLNDVEDLGLLEQNGPVIDRLKE
jgi:hypothetical protein